MSARITVAVGLNSSSIDLNENKRYLLRSYHLFLYLVSVVTRQRIKQISYWWLKYCQLYKKGKKNEERLEKKLKALSAIDFIKRLLSSSSENVWGSTHFISKIQRPQCLTKYLVLENIHFFVILLKSKHLKISTLLARSFLNGFEP